MTRTRKDIEKDIDGLEWNRKSAWDEFYAIEQRYLHDGERNLEELKASLYKRYNEICEGIPAKKASLEEELSAFDRGPEAYQKLLNQRKKQINAHILNTFKSDLDYYLKEIEKSKNKWLGSFNRNDDKYTQDMYYKEHSRLEKDLDDFVRRSLSDEINMILEKSSILVEYERYEDAIVYYDKVLSSKPNNIDCLKKITKLLAKTGRINEGIIYCNRILELAPSDTFAFDHKKQFNDKLREYKQLKKRKKLILYASVAVIAIILVYLVIQNVQNKQDVRNSIEIYSAGHYMQDLTRAVLPWQEIESKWVLDNVRRGHDGYRDRLVFRRQGASVVLPVISVDATKMKITIVGTRTDWLVLETSFDGISFSKQGKFKKPNKRDRNSTKSLPDGTKYVRLSATKTLSGGSSPWSVGVPSFWIVKITGITTKNTE